MEGKPERGIFTADTGELAFYAPEYGSAYVIRSGELCQCPGNSDEWAQDTGHWFDLEEAGSVAWDCIDEGEIAPLREIEQELSTAAGIEAVTRTD